MSSSNVPAPSNVVADPKRPWKAVVAAVVALVGLLWAALEGKADNWGNMSVQEWISVLVPVLLTFAATYITPNPKVIDTHNANRRVDDGLR